MAVELDTTGNGAIDIEKGGTNATSAVQALSNLGGQPLDSNLTALATGTYAQKRAIIESAAKPVLDIDTLRTTVADFDGDCRYLVCRTTNGDGGHGIFVWSTADLSAEVAADPIHDIYAAPTSDPTGASGAWVRQGMYEKAAVPDTATIGGLLVSDILRTLNSAANTDDAEISGMKMRLVAGTIRQEGPHEVVSLTRTGTTVTVSDPGHRYKVGDYVFFAGANEEEYNNLFQITVAGIDFYEFEIATAPTSPATGTVTVKCPGLWDWIKDSTHQPIGVDSSAPVRPGAGGYGLRIPLDKTYTKVGSIIAGPDEQLSASYCMSLGNSVALNAFEIRGGLSKTIAGRVYWDGTQWLKTMGNEQRDITGFDYINGNLTIKHTYCPDYNVHVSPNNASGTISAPYVPIVKSPTAKQCIINFLDTISTTEAGSLVSTTYPTTRMGLSFTKHYAGIFKFDGTDGSYDLNMQYGNIWFIGVMYE